MNGLMSTGIATARCIVIYPEHPTRTKTRTNRA